MARFDAELQELEAVGGAQVEKISAGTSDYRTERSSGKAGLFESAADVLPDFVTRAADAGSEGGQEGGRIGTITFFHPQDDLLQDTPGGPFPTAMDRGYNTLFSFDKKDRHAVGRPDGQQKAGPTCDRRITPQSPPWHLVDEVDDVGVHLVKEEGFQALAGGEPTEVSLPP